MALISFASHQCSSHGLYLDAQPSWQLGPFHLLRLGALWALEPLTSKARLSLVLIAAGSGLAQPHQAPGYWAPCAALGQQNKALPFPHPACIVQGARNTTSCCLPALPLTPSLQQEQIRIRSKGRMAAFSFSLTSFFMKFFFSPGVRRSPKHEIYSRGAGPGFCTSPALHMPLLWGRDISA